MKNRSFKWLEPHDLRVWSLETVFFEVSPLRHNMRDGFSSPTVHLTLTLHTSESVLGTERRWEGWREGPWESKADLGWGWGSWHGLEQVVIGAPLKWQSGKPVNKKKLIFKLQKHRNSDLPSGHHLTALWPWTNYFSTKHRFPHLKQEDKLQSLHCPVKIRFNMHNLSDRGHAIKDVISLYKVIKRKGEFLSKIP